MNYSTPCRKAALSPKKSPIPQPQKPEAVPGERRDAAQLLLWTINEWSRNKQAQEAAVSGRRGKINRMRTKVRFGFDKDRHP